jgi:hypothetical protein
MSHSDLLKYEGREVASSSVADGMLKLLFFVGQAAIIGQNNFCEAAVRVKRFLYASPFSPGHTSSVQRVSCQPSVRALSWAINFRPAHYWIRSAGGTICITALDCCQVIFRARRPSLKPAGRISSCHSGHAAAAAGVLSAPALTCPLKSVPSRHIA